MIRAHSLRTPIALAALMLAGVEAAGAQAPQAPQVLPPPVAAGRAAVPVLRPPPALAPAPPTRGAARIRASVAPVAVAPSIGAPVGSTPPDSIQRGRARIALATPVPLVREAPRYRVREFGTVRNDVALQPAPTGATGRCRDGTYLTSTPSEEACTGKGGLSIRLPTSRPALATPSRQP